MQLGSTCPAFDLPGTDGERHTLASFSGAKALVVIVSCNHCPYVIAYEPRVVAFSKKYQAMGARFLAVNGNDATRYPDDAMEPMTERARSRGFDFPYVRDDSQSFVRTLGARFTPEVFVFDAKHALAYHGRIDDNHRDESRVTSHDLRDALDAIIEGKEPKVRETVAFGCSVKWK